MAFTLNLLVSLPLVFLIFSSPTSANRNPDERAFSPDEETTGFVENINFNDFFEDVGLHGAHSEPVAAIHQAGHSDRDNRQDESSVDEYGDGFMPSDPMRGFEASPSTHFEITSEDDFYAAESSPFEDFYGFDDHSSHHRGHSSPFASTRRRYVYSSPSEDRPLSSSDFRDFGPPKGFFDDAFEGELTKAQSAQAEEQSKQLAEKEDPSKKKCETVVKKGMTCEVCNDGYGGFSEHCQHSLNSGKDQKYANSRRNAKDGVYKPHGPDEGFHPDETEEREVAPRRKSSNKEQVEYAPRRQTKRQRPREQPRQEEPVYDEEESSAAPEPVYDNRRRHEPQPQPRPIKRRHHNVSPASTQQRHAKKRDDGYSETNADKVYAPKKEVSKDRHIGKEAFYDPYPDHNVDHYSSGSARINLKPIDPEENFKVLNKMMKKFSKKERNNCKKRTTKKGMTCYVCPNKHGHVDEECMYENDDPSKGVHMMYKEESSY